MHLDNIEYPQLLPSLYQPWNLTTYIITVSLLYLHWISIVYTFRIVWNLEAFSSTLADDSSATLINQLIALP